MRQSKIEWTDVTVNPFPGCMKVSPGCENCYAERMAMRLKTMGLPQYEKVVDARGSWTGEVGCNPAAMMIPGKGQRVFCQSMGDLFYEGVTDDQILWAYDQIRTLGLSGHTVQVLTKRPERAADLLPRIEFDNHGKGRMWYGKTWLVPFVRLLRNHWFGVTAENQEWADKRIPILMQIPAAVRFVSMEPLLGPFAGNRTRRIDWVIVGCESGPKRRPCDNRWVAGIVAQCHAASVPVFVKQIQVKNRVVKDPNTISNQLGYPPESIRQFPRPRFHKEDKHHD